MIRQIAPQFFTTDIQATLDYYRDKLGFDCLSTWQNPPVYAIVARDQHAITFGSPSRLRRILTNTQTSSSTRTYSLRTRTRSTPSMPPEVSNSREASATCPGSPVNSS